MSRDSSSITAGAAIFPLPAATNVFLVWGDEDEFEGPLLAVAVAQATRTHKLETNPDIEIAEEWLDKAPEETVEYGSTWFLCLFADFGDRENTWVRGSCVFFSQAAALTSLKERRESAARIAARKESGKGAP